MQPPDPPFALRVLVVEDLRDCADSMALLLELWGYQPAVAYAGERALEMVAASLPDVVLLDIGLPGMDGYEVARRLRRLPGMDTTLLIAVTGYGRETELKHCKEAGIDCHFLKPVDLARLQQVLAKVEKLRREQRQLAC